MKRYILTAFFLSTGIFLMLSAQEKVTITLERQFIEELFKTIEKETDYTIHSLPEETDSLRVSVQVVAVEPIEAIQEALKNQPFSVNSYGKRIFVLKEKNLITQLPEGFYQQERSVDEDAYDLSGIALMSDRRSQKATSESKVYEIGDESNNPKGRVTLTGSVVDFKTGEPMIGVAMFIEEPMIGVTTDAFGYYSIQLPPGRQELHIRGMGMKDTKRQLMLYSDGKLDIELEEQVYSLKEVTISSEKIANVRNTTLGMERVQIKDIKNIPTAFGEVDILRVVMSLPGVKAVGEASSGFNVRGGATDQNLILFNDGTIYNPTHLFGFFSAFTSITTLAS